MERAEPEREQDPNPPPPVERACCPSGRCADDLCMWLFELSEPTDEA